MPHAPANGIELYYEETGDPGGRPLVLVSGVGSQLIRFPEGLAERLVATGHRLIRFDNRDTGLSSKLEGRPRIRAVARGEEPPLYRLDDMADDVAGLLDALDVAGAHIWGSSLGGMIAQLFAIRHPQRTLTLVSAMSSPGGRDHPRSSREAHAAFIAPPPRERDARIEHDVHVARIMSGPGFPFDEQWWREVHTRSYDRCYCPDGFRRQYAAVLAAPSRVEPLGRLTMPALVLHGDADPLIPLEGGSRTARAIPGARLLVIEGMGHDYPQGAWDLIVAAVTDLTISVTARSQ